jgi:hypothetical protein
MSNPPALIAVKTPAKMNPRGFEPDALSALRVAVIRINFPVLLSACLFRCHSTSKYEKDMIEMSTDTASAWMAAVT